jgi:hypothetical protein
VRLPAHIGDYYLGKHFHFAYDENTNRYYIRDYDCLVNISSPAAADAIERFAVQQYLMGMRTKESVLVYK